MKSEAAVSETAVPETMALEAVEEEAKRLIAGGNTAILPSESPKATSGSEPGSVAQLRDGIASHWFTTPEALALYGRTGEITFSYGGEFSSKHTLAYLGRDKANLAEQVQGHCYTRFMPVASTHRKIQICLETSGVQLKVLGSSSHPASPSTASPLPDADALLMLLDKAISLLGLRQPLATFYRDMAGHPVMAPIIQNWRGVRVPQVASLWEGICWAVVGQQINLAFAYTLRNALIAMGNGVGLHSDKSNGNAHTWEPLPFPSPQQVLEITEKQWREAKFSRQKAAYLHGLAGDMVEGVLDEARLTSMDEAQAREHLLSRKGLGPWSVNYVLLRALGRMDALPVGDSGLRSALHRFFDLPEKPDISAQEALMEPLRPWRGLATSYLWKALDHSRQD